MTKDEIQAEIQRVQAEGDLVLREVKLRYEGVIGYLQEQLRKAEEGEDAVDETAVSE